MNFLNKLIGKSDVFFDLLEEGAEEAQVSVDLFSKFLRQMDEGKQPAGLDDFLDCIDREPRIILADMGADGVAELRVRFTALGVITSDPASVASVLGWAGSLQNRVDYMVVENSTTPDADFRYWRDSEPATRFREVFHPVLISMGYRLPEFENTVRHHGVRLSHVADGTTEVEALQMTRMTIRAQSYRKQLFTAFETAKEVLLP